jgi:diamine N-acetyltransferase
MPDRYMIRTANTGDAEALAHFYRKVLTETLIEDFAMPYPPDDLAAFFGAHASSELFMKYTSDSTRLIWLVEEKSNQSIVAFCHVGLFCESLHPEIQVNVDGQLKHLYVQRDHQRGGIGHRLMHLALSWFDEHHPQRTIWLTVWSGNVRAQHFYQCYGFAVFTQFNFSVGKSTDLEFIMRRLGQKASDPLCDFR